MEPAFLGLVLDSSIVIDAERKRRTVEELLTAIKQRFGEVEIVISAITVAELVHGWNEHLRQKSDSGAVLL